MRRALTFGLLAAAVLALPAGARTPRRAQPAAISKMWAALNKLGLVLDNVASLSDGGVERGSVWTYRLSTGERRRITTVDDLAWPVIAPGKDYGFALRGKQLVRFELKDGQIQIVANGVNGRLIAVTGADDVFAWLDEGELGRLAAISPSGRISRLPAVTREDDRRRMAALVSESRAYSGGIVLDVRRAPESRTGFDVFLLRNGSATNVTRCGDSRCGQPSLGPGRDNVLYVREDGG